MMLLEKTQIAWFIYNDTPNDVCQAFSITSLSRSYNVTKSYTVASDKTPYESFAVHIQITDIDTRL